MSDGTPVVTVIDSGQPYRDRKRFWWPLIFVFGDPVVGAFRLRKVCLSLLIPCVIAASGCVQEGNKSPFTGFFKNYSTCRAEYQAMDARIDAAGVRDASFYRVPGFPYLRTDRMIASYRHEVRNMGDKSSWVRRMREMDQSSREDEYINLGMSEYEAATQRDRFLNCGRVLEAVELGTPTGWERLTGVVQPVDEYSGLARTLGFHVFAAVAMKSRLAELHDAAVQEYTKPLDAPSPGAALRLWTVKPVEDMTLLENVHPVIMPNELGFPNLLVSAWRSLAELHAPQLWIETVDETDRPAAPKLSSTGPAADPARPLVNYDIDFTRFGGKTLVQINYFFWFKSADGAVSGPIDGFIWRVTLDDQLQPLVYESLHASGRDHRWYPVQPLQLRGPDGRRHEIEFVAPEPAPARSATLRLRSGSHEIRRVVSAEQVPSGESSQFELRPYDDLLVLPRPEGGTRSLFGPDGLISGTYGKDPISTFASGIRSPGTLREYGHYPIAYIGRRQFDDPFLLELTFSLPPGYDEERIDKVPQTDPPMDSLIESAR